MAFTPNSMSRNSGVAATMNAISSLGVAATTDGVVAMSDDESLGFLVDMQTTEMRSLTFTFTKGSRWGSDLGALTVVVGPTTSGGYSNASKMIGPFESYRFKDASGNLTFTALWSTDTAPASSFMTATYAQFAVFKMPNKV